MTLIISWIIHELTGLSARDTTCRLKSPAHVETLHQGDRGGVNCLLGDAATHTHTLQRQPTGASERERQRERAKRRQARLFSHPLDVDCTLFSPWHHHGTGSRGCWEIRCAASSIISLRWPCTRAAGGRNASGSLRRTAACSGRLTESARARACVQSHSPTKPLPSWRGC